MNCEEARQRWHRRLDEGTSDRELDQHLEACPACRRYDQDMNRVVDALDELHVETESIVSHGRRDDWSPTGRRGIHRLQVALRPALALAAVLAIALTASLFLSSESLPPTTGLVVTDDEPFKEETPLGLTLRGETAERYLAVAKPVSQENVQVFWLYPTLRSEPEVGPS